MANYSAKATLLKIGDGGGPENFTTVAQVVDIQAPKLKLATLDVTNMSSTSGWKEKVAGLLDGGAVTFTINYDPGDSTHKGSGNGLLNVMKNRTLRNFQLIFPDSGATQWSFAAFVSDFQVKAPVAGKLEASVTLDISGVPTIN